ncbi:N-dimethylarginine dimethylaminohydrolase [Mycobacteroides chelonae]|nr:N-dimethylarginine dimethylaminohydrolase [Mycobacteroides chelonae]
MTAVHEGGHPASSPTEQPDRTPTTRHYVMVPPTYYTVEYAINPWMDVTNPVDPALATAQWDALRATYERLGHTVDILSPVAGLPDMVYAANGGIVLRGNAVVARFKHAERAGEADAHAEWMRGHGLRAMHSSYTNEGQGDFLLAGDIILAGTGFRTDVRSHVEIARMLEIPVVTLELVDPRFYHLDTALAVLDAQTVAYHPPAFSAASQARLKFMYPNAIIASSADACVLGMNAVSDGRHVMLPARATGFAEQLRAAGFEPIGIDLSELLKGGGSVKCCTLELHS